MPEGYKNQAKPPMCSSAVDGDGVNGQRCSRRDIVRRPIELMPYCGILHVGGLEATVSDADGLAALQSDSHDAESPSRARSPAALACVDGDSFRVYNDRKRSRGDLHDDDTDACGLGSLAPLAYVNNFDSFPTAPDRTERPLLDAVSDDESDIFRPNAILSPLRPIPRPISHRRSSDLNRRSPPQAQAKSSTLRKWSAAGVTESEMIDADDFEEATFLEHESSAGSHYV